MSFLSVLGVIFIVLKLLGIILWSWWWVLCPFWLVPALGLTIMLLALINGNVKVIK